MSLYEVCTGTYLVERMNLNGEVHRHRRSTRMMCERSPDAEAEVL